MTNAGYSGRYDVIVIGAGAMGSATAYYLARRGKRVLCIERFGIPHSMGSSHGQTRIIRLAYFEHPSYVALLRRAYELWRGIQATAGEQLLHITGSVDIGPEDSFVVRGSLESCKLHGLPYETLTTAELRRRYPAYHPPEDFVTILQPDGGYLTPERCIVSYVVAAQELGAEFHARERALEWEPLENGARVRTDRGTYEAEKLVVAAGAWAGKLVGALGALGGLVVPERQVLAWLQPRRPEYFRPEKFPVFSLLVDEGRFYGFPIHGVPGFKFGKYNHLREVVDPETVDREVHERDERVLREFAERYFPDGSGPAMDYQTCMFTNTEDERFVLDLHPEYPQVALASPCSGHGFKFASVVGEIMADLAETGTTGHDIGMFRLDRLTRPHEPENREPEGRAAGVERLGL